MANPLLFSVLQREILPNSSFLSLLQENILLTHGFSLSPAGENVLLTTPFSILQEKIFSPLFLHPAG
jgi:hypothetical protein